jgi:hypothetical protein
MEQFKELFTAFAADQQAELQDLPVFKKGVDFYLSQLNLNFSGILQELDADISTSKEYKNW